MNSVKQDCSSSRDKTGTVGVQYTTVCIPISHSAPNLSMHGLTSQYLMANTIL